jgi:hypothetical protein
MKGNLITTHTDRLRHMEQCRKWDISWQREHGGILPSEQHYENVGDIATFNSWIYHDPEIGFHRLYANTPDWIVDIAARRYWVSDRGELTLCANCNNSEGGCPVCCPEAYAGDAV